MIKKQFDSKMRSAIGIALLACVDVIILSSVVFSSMVIRKDLLPLIFRSMPDFEFSPWRYHWIFLFWLAVLAYNGAYTKRFTFWDEVRALWKTTFIISVAAITFLFIGKEGGAFSRTFLLSGCLLSLFFFPMMRPAMKRIIYRLGFLKRKLLILGSGEAARMALRAVRREKNLGYKVVGFVGETTNNGSGNVCNGGLIYGMKVHGFLDKAERYIERCSIHDVMIATPGMDKERLTDIINRVQRKAENTLYMSDISAVSVLGAELKYFGSQEGLVIELKNNLRRLHNYILKKIFDFIAGFILTVVFLVPILAISLLIRATSKGPAIFKQRRIGRGGRAFWCYKFRTMYEDADEKLEEILKADPDARHQWETYWKLKDDPRVTKAGKFLRETSLDELPQLFNVLLGQMSIVGPRPYLEREREHLLRFEETILWVPPGITGLWQTSGRNRKTFRERLALDDWYVRNWNLWLDFIILFKTIYVVIKKEGAH